MSKPKKTNERFLAEIYNLVKYEYAFLEVYKGDRTNIAVRHDKCGNIYFVRPNNFLSGKRCPICARVKAGNKKRKTHEQFIQDVYSLVGNEYTVLDEYKAANIKVLIKHNKCGCEYLVFPGNFLYGKRCPECAKRHIGRCNALTEREFTEKLKEKTNGKCVALDKYTNNSLKISFLNLNCGHIFKTQPKHVLAGHICPICGNKKIGEKFRKTHDLYIEEVKKKSGNEYTLLTQYINDKEKIEFRHNICNRVFTMAAGSFLQGTRCPHCSESKGEKKVYDYLVSKNIAFIREYRDKRCKNKYTLPFDFAIIKDKQLLVLIEYDGELHYKMGRWSNAKERHLTIKKTEAIKNAFCQNSNIPLIRIPYWEYENIENTLDKKLSEFGIFN